MNILKKKNEKIIEMLKEFDFDYVDIDEEVINMWKTFNNYTISIYFNNVIKEKENEFSDFYYNTYYLYDEKDVELTKSKNLYEIMLYITDLLIEENN